MSLNTSQTFNLKGSKIFELYGYILGLQRLARADTSVKVMLADNTDALETAVATIKADPDYATDPETVLAATYQVTGYRIEENQVPPNMTVSEIRAIRPFINL